MIYKKDKKTTQLSNKWKSISGKIYLPTLVKLQLIDSVRDIFHKIHTFYYKIDYDNNNSQYKQLLETP